MKTKTYNSFRGMRERCNNPNNKEFIRYGGRGIAVCDRWESFKNFLEDMGERPDGTTLDRIDNNKGYYKENCRWVDMTTQARNQRVRKDNKFGVKGINYRDSYNAYCVRISINGKRKHLGYFKRLEDAIKARREAELMYWK